MHICVAISNVFCALTYTNQGNKLDNTVKRKHWGKLYLMYGNIFNRSECKNNNGINMNKLVNYKLMHGFKSSFSHPKWSIRVSSFVAIGHGSPVVMWCRRQWDQLKQEQQSGSHLFPNSPLSPSIYCSHPPAACFYTHLAMVPPAKLSR